ncbi:hypothetical protein EGR_01406 [Echinococcus granulosus]|uniref:Uncharacterized protein n=1 Tax=Echinococcus granulosus TaxID=6210 RepID=W6URC9_ECHGR|nr:hypothetical protein EGR_01406 [Echinococcus granulosus]EUB63783.1 hypothetical protein EGR_01406 [Echinococcus granulosus]
MLYDYQIMNRYFKTKKNMAKLSKSLMFCLPCRLADHILSNYYLKQANKNVTLYISINEPIFCEDASCRIRSILFPNHVYGTQNSKTRNFKLLSLASSKINNFGTPKHYIILHKNDNRTLLIMLQYHTYLISSTTNEPSFREENARSEWLNIHRCMVVMRISSSKAEKNCTFLQISPRGPKCEPQDRYAYIRADFISVDYLFANKKIKN